MVSAAGITATLLAALPVLGLGGVGAAAAPSSEFASKQPARVKCQLRCESSEARAQVAGVAFIAREALSRLDLHRSPYLLAILAHSVSANCCSQVFWCLFHGNGKRQLPAQAAE